MTEPTTAMAVQPRSSGLANTANGIVTPAYPIDIRASFAIMKRLKLRDLASSAVPALRQRSSRTVRTSRTLDTPAKINDKAPVPPNIGPQSKSRQNPLSGGQSYLDSRTPSVKSQNAVPANPATWNETSPTSKRAVRGCKTGATSLAAYPIASAETEMGPANTNKTIPTRNIAPKTMREPCQQENPAIRRSRDASVNLEHTPCIPAATESEERRWARCDAGAIRLLTATRAGARPFRPRKRVVRCEETEWRCRYAVQRRSSVRRKSASQARTAKFATSQWSQWAK